MVIGPGTTRQTTARIADRRRVERCGHPCLRRHSPGRGHWERRAGWGEMNRQNRSGKGTEVGKGHEHTEGPTEKHNRSGNRRSTFIALGIWPDPVLMFPSGEIHSRSYLMPYSLLPFV